MARPYFDDDNPTDEANHWMHFLMRGAVHEINEAFGDGYAKDHPDLVGAYLQAAAAIMSRKTLGSNIDNVAGSLSEVSSALNRVADEIPAFPVEE